MATVTFDTLKFVETLKEAGVPEPQAKAFSTAVQESHEAADLATKADLREYESVIRGDLEKLETGLRHEMNELETGLRQEMNELKTGLRHEMNELKTGLRHEMNELETSLRHEIGDLRHEMKELELRIDTRFEKVHGEMLLTKWMLGLLLAGVASLVLKAFFGV
jgi:DNA-binding transcriptional MerR regulator